MKRDYLYMCLLLLCSLLFCTGCTENEMWADEETVSEGLVLNLLASGEAVVAGRSIASDEDLREDVVENVDVFFFAADTKEELARY